MTKAKVPKQLDAVVGAVLKYRPTSRIEPARQRKRRRTILENKRAKESGTSVRSNWGHVNADDNYLDFLFSLLGN